MQKLSGTRARAVVLATGLGHSSVTARDVLARERLIQLDPISRVDKAHRLTCAARLPPDAANADADGHLWSDALATSFETYAGVACLFPVEDWPLLEPSRARARTRSDRLPSAAYDVVLGIVASHPGGATITQIEHESQRSGSWSWSQRKQATEQLVWQGDLVVTTRRGVRRVYDLPDRRLPAHVRDIRDGEETLAGLAAAALGTLGVATAKDLGTHYRLTADQVRTGLWAVGAQEYDVAGWTTPGYALPGVVAALPAGDPVLAPRIIGPFDNLLRNRDRARTVFGFDYLFEAYKPANTRVHGAYTLSVMTGDGFTGRIDAARVGTTLNFHRLFPEPGTSDAAFAAHARVAGRHLAAQLGADLRIEGRPA